MKTGNKVLAAAISALLLGSVSFAADTATGEKTAGGKKPSEKLKKRMQEAKREKAETREKGSDREKDNVCNKNHPNHVKGACDGKGDK